MTERFAFDFAPRYRAPLAVLGITPHTAYVDVGDRELDAHFGPWRFRTPITNVRGVYVTGPYRWYRAIGARGSFADRGLTFGTTTRGGVCLVLAEPTPGLEPTGRFRHPGVTFTVAEPRRFADALLARMGEERPLSSDDSEPAGSAPRR